jgi:hypothetical protein
MRGRVCRLQLLLALASAVILGSESRRLATIFLLSQFRDFPFRRLLRLTGLRPRLHTGYEGIVKKFSEKPDKGEGRVGAFRPQDFLASFTFHTRSTPRKRKYCDRERNRSGHASRITRFQHR